MSWEIIESLNWDGDYKRCEKQLVDTYSMDKIIQVETFVDEKVNQLDKQFHQDWLDDIEVSDDGWSDLRYEVVGRGKLFYESITKEKLMEMAENFDYHESFAYCFHCTYDYRLNKRK
jgi:hypothetical protein